MYSQIASPLIEDGPGSRLSTPFWARWSDNIICRCAGGTPAAFHANHSVPITVQCKARLIRTRRILGQISRCWFRVFALQNRRTSGASPRSQNRRRMSIMACLQELASYKWNRNPTTRLEPPVSYNPRAEVKVLVWLSQYWQACELMCGLSLLIRVFRKSGYFPSPNIFQTSTYGRLWKAAILSSSKWFWLGFRSTAWIRLGFADTR